MQTRKQLFIDEMIIGPEMRERRGEEEEEDERGLQYLYIKIVNF